MEYQKLIKLIDNTPNQPTKFRIANWVEVMIQVDCIKPIIKLNSKVQW